MRWVFFIPLVLFLGLSAVFMLRMADDKPTDEIPSALIGREAPDLNLQRLSGVDTPLLTSDVFGKSDVLVLNVWASHCGPCRVEHPQISALSYIDGVIVAGLNQKDDEQKALRFLETLGNPFDYIGTDPDGAVSLQYGVYGLPETFLIDRDGVIRAKYIGAITEGQLNNEIRPLIARIRNEN